MLLNKNTSGAKIGRSKVEVLPYSLGSRLLELPDQWLSLLLRPLTLSLVSIYPPRPISCFYTCTYILLATSILILKTYQKWHPLSLTSSTTPVSRARLKFLPGSSSTTNGQSPRTPTQRPSSEYTGYFNMYVS